MQWNVSLYEFLHRNVLLLIWIGEDPEHSSQEIWYDLSPGALIGALQIEMKDKRTAKKPHINKTVDDQNHSAGVFNIALQIDESSASLILIMYTQQNPDT